MSLDALLDTAAIILPTVLSVVGVLVSIKAPHSKHHRLWRAALICIGVTISGVTFWQQSRSRSAHASEVNGLNGMIGGLNGQVTSLGTELKGMQTNLDQITGKNEQESARRQQAERDLALIIRGVGQATREGVASDLKRTPFKVEVNGQPVVDTAEKKRLREALAKYMQQGINLRERCRTDPAKPQLEAEAQKWYEAVQTFLKNNFDTSFLAQFIESQPRAFMPGGVPSELVGLWLGIDNRVQTLNKFIDQLR